MTKEKIIQLVRLSGLKMYIAGIAMMLYGAYQFFKLGQEEGVKTIAEGFAFCGGRAAVEKLVNRLVHVMRQKHDTGEHG